VSDIFLLGKYASDLKTTRLIDEGKSAYFPDPRCYIVIETTDGDELSLSYEVVSEINRKYIEWNNKNGKTIKEDNSC
jgi:hypothetical protein